MDELSRRTFNFFWELADSNAQTPDRWPNLAFSSTAATGFGLGAYLVGVERGYITRQQAAARTLACLTFLKNLPQGMEKEGTGGYKGFFYHFLDHKTGRRFKDVELSTIDSGLLLAGVLAAQTYFDGENEAEKAIRETAEFLYRRVEWDWMLNKNYRLSMGWRPERGFIQSEWAGYNEAMVLYLLALGSPTHPIPERSWQAWCDGYYFDRFEGQEFVQFGPLFGHQYSQIWVDFREIQDKYMAEKGLDYFENSRRATLANQTFCEKNEAGHAGFSKKIWGLTACDGPADWLNRHEIGSQCLRECHEFQGYSARGAASDYGVNDGTISPTAAGGSIPFAPGPCLEALETMWTNFGDSLVGKYGFKDAFNPSFTACGRLPNGWFDKDYLGIDQGPILLMLENYRSGLLWNLMKRNPHIVAGLKHARFSGGWLDDAEPKIVKHVGTSTKPNLDVPCDPKALFSKQIFRGPVPLVAPRPEISGGKNGGQPLPFRFLKPQIPLKNGEKYPLVIFLHGSGERGADNELPLKNGVLALAERDFQQKHPCFVLAPQLAEGQQWANFTRDWHEVVFNEKEPSAAGAAVIELVEKMLAENPLIDPARIYLTGLSNGGFGTFDLLTRRPDLFAAGLPICGGGDPAFASKLKGKPVWIFHGKLDEAVPVAHSKRMFEALKKQGNEVKFTEFETLGHAVWQEVFYNPEVWNWLFEKRRVTSDK